MLVRTEFKLFLREPAALFWAIAFPLILLVVMGSIPSSREPSHDLGGLRFIDAYTPVLVVFVLCILALNALPPVLAGYRERGVLRRLDTTPAGAVRVLGAQLAINLAVAAATWLGMLLVARLAFDVPLPAQPLGFLVAIVLVAGALLALGLLLAAVAPSARAANLLGAMAFFPMMFFAGLWVPRAAMGDTLRHVGDFTPLGAAAASVQAAMEGDWPRLLHLGVLAGWTVVCGGAAIRLFRWSS